MASYAVWKGTLKSYGKEPYFKTKKRAQAFAVYYNIKCKTGESKRLTEDGRALQRERNYWT